MNQQEYSQAIEELVVPSSKVLIWAQVIKENYYNEFSKLHGEYLEGILENSQKLVNLIPEIKMLTTELDKLEAVTHRIAGPIMVIRDYAKLLLTLRAQSNTDKEPEQYLIKIESTAQYLWTLNRDILLSLHLDSPNDD